MTDALSQEHQEPEKTVTAETPVVGPLVWEGERAPLAKAFVAAQKATEAVKKASTNPAFRSKYADLAGVVEAVVPALNDAGVGVIQTPTFDGQWVNVTTTLLHESGSSVSGTLALRPTKSDPQGVGSAITYARRYSLLAMTGAAPEDDDGNAASAQTTQAPANQTRVPSGLSVHAEGKDWWNCEGHGPTAAQAKREGLGELAAELRNEITGLTSAAEWRDWCRQNTDRIRPLPQSWRVELRNHAEATAVELGVDLNTREAA